MQRYTLKRITHAHAVVVGNTVTLVGELVNYGEMFLIFRENVGEAEECEAPGAEAVAAPVQEKSAEAEAKEEGQSDKQQ